MDEAILTNSCNQNQRWRQGTWTHNLSPANSDYYMQIRTEDYPHRYARLNTVQSLGIVTETLPAVASMVLRFPYHLTNQQSQQQQKHQRRDSPGEVISTYHHHHPDRHRHSVVAEKAVSDKEVVEQRTRESDTVLYSVFKRLFSIQNDSEKRKVVVGEDEKKNKTQTGGERVHYKALSIHRQIGSIRRLMPLMFFLLFVTASALPPVIRIGE